MLQPAPAFFGRYDARDVNAFFDGNLLDGYGEDMIEIARDENKILNRYIGGRGDAVLGINNNTAGSVTLTFLDKAPIIDYLHKAAHRRIVAPLSIEYKIGQRVILDAPESYIEELPEYAFKSQPTDRVFMIGFTYINQDVSNL